MKENEKDSEKTHENEFDRLKDFKNKMAIVGQNWKKELKKDLINQNFAKLALLDPLVQDSLCQLRAFILTLLLRDPKILKKKRKNFLPLTYLLTDIYSEREEKNHIGFLSFKTKPYTGFKKIQAFKENKSFSSSFKKWHYDSLHFILSSELANLSLESLKDLVNMKSQNNFKEKKEALLEIFKEESMLKKNYRNEK